MSRQVTLLANEPAKRKNVTLPDHPYDEKQLLVDSDPQIMREIKYKLAGYKSQDKRHFEEEKIRELAAPTPTPSETRQMLLDADLCCFYCRQAVKILYDNVKEPNQWTLERIDNQLGHTNSNVVIACLSCNLGRRTIYHERYAFTKQFASNVVKNGVDL
jgi:hypothetical protein